MEFFSNPLDSSAGSPSRLYWIPAPAYIPRHVTEKNNFWPHVIQSGCGYQGYAAERSYRYGRKSRGVGKDPGCLGGR
jgi:hypothetical protein